MITKYDVDQGSEEWFALRENKYTGSGADKLLKFGAIEYSLTQAAELFSTFWTRRGHLLELEATGLYEQIYHVTVKHAGFVTNSKYPNAGYSPDGFTDYILLESKSFDEARHLEIVAMKEPPFEILAQAHFGLTIMELDMAHIIFYHPKVDPKLALKIFEVKMDPKTRANFRNILRGKK